jgi:hypothetical protein
MPALPPELVDFTAEPGYRTLHSVPVRVPMLLNDALAVSF